MRPRALQICHFLRGYFGPKNRSRGHRLVSFCGGSGAGAPCFCIKKHRRPFKNEANANICQPSSTENDEHIQKWLWIKTTYALFGSIWGGSIHAFSSYFGVNTEHWTLGPMPKYPNTSNVSHLIRASFFGPLGPWVPELLDPILATCWRPMRWRPHRWQPQAAMVQEDHEKGSNPELDF